MRPRIAISALGALDTPLADFLSSILASKITEEFDILLIVRADRELPDYVALSGIKTHRLSARDGILPFHQSVSDLREISTLYDEFPFEVVHATGPEDQRLFCYWYLLYKKPFLIIRTWFRAENIADTMMNRIIFNRLTAVNLFFDRDTESLMRDKRPQGALFMHHPCVLNDSFRLSPHGIGLLEHCYLSLTTPSRSHPVSGIKTDWSGIELTYITHFYLNQGSPDAIMRLLRRYEQYSPEVLDRLHFVIVDDGSPLDYDIPALNLNITWLKINEDIRWNQPGARNLGAMYAKSDKILLTDLDHEFPEDTIRAMIEAGPCGRNIYKIYRRDPETGRRRKGHSNIFFMSRARLFRHWGYDEEFSGHYGSDDFRFIKYQKAQGSRLRYFDSDYTCIKREDIDRTREYHSLSRDLSYNTPVDARKKFEMNLFGHEAGHSRMFLDFTWTKMYEHRREIHIERTVDRAWKRLWIWRWLVGGR
jgi:glycosyltransferase involved in cell wall biosynthesis